MHSSKVKPPLRTAQHSPMAFPMQMVLLVMNLYLLCCCLSVSNATHCVMLEVLWKLVHTVQADFVLLQTKLLICRTAGPHVCIVSARYCTEDAQQD